MSWGVPAHGAEKMLHTSDVIATRVAMSTALPVSSPVTVRVFTNGGSQAVTIPRQFRLLTKRATVTRRGDTLIIKPATQDDSWDAMWDDLTPLGSSFKRWPTAAAEVREVL